MNWEKIAAEDFAVHILKKHIEKKRLSSTYLLTGPESAPKEDVALAFASALNCEKGSLFELCECPSCIKISRGTHPDVRRLGDEDRASIKIEEVRNLIGWVQLKPYEGSRKVFIVPKAEDLTPAASNALLKTLEEPPPNTIFCLLTESRSHLLETIQSRSFELRLKSFSDPESDQAPEIAEKIKQIKNGNWDDLLEPYHSKEREVVDQLFMDLMRYFRAQIAASGEDEKVTVIPPYLKAFQAVYEAREALSENANQKLTLSWLAMNLMKACPAQARG